MYPLLFKPNLHKIVWGGHRLQSYKGVPATDEPIGESWEVSAVETSPSIIANGPWAGHNLIELVSQFPDEILGESVAKRYGNKLPLLVKFIDAERDLSIQVHPDDGMAMREHGKFGKTEMWYIIDAKPGAYIYAGFKEAITPYEYRKRVEDGSICDVLARHEVNKGDVFYIPAGRVHAICGGIMLAEVQQSSDLTYRIYDYNRPGLDGQPRQLHTELAAKAIDFHVEKDYRTHYPDIPERAVPVIDTPYFDVRVTDVAQPFHRNLIKYDSFVISMCIKGTCRIRLRDAENIDYDERDIVLREGHSCLIPASIADYDLIPVTKTAKILEAHIDNKDRSLPAMFTRFFHITKK